MSEKEMVLLMEEAHAYISNEKIKRCGGEPLVIKQLRMGRKNFVYAVVVDQTPSLLPQAVLANLASRVVMRPTNDDCATAISLSMGLNRAQHDELVKLPRRLAIVQTADLPEPFLIRVVDIEERHRPPEEELLERERQSLAMLNHVMPGIDVADVLLGVKDEKEVSVIRGDMFRVLARICEYPFEVIEDRSDAVGIERSRENRSRKKLVIIGMVELADKVGSKTVLYMPTDKGRRWAESLGIEVPRFKSGVGHEYMLRRVKDSLGGFFGEEIEFFSAGESLGISGIQPDLLAGMHRSEVESGWRMVVQISRTNKARYEVDRAVDLSRIAQIDLVVIVAKNKGHRRDILRKMKEGSSKEGLFARNGGQSGQGDSADASDAVRGNHGQGAENPKEPETHFQKGTAPIQVVDFETSVSDAYDWGWVVG